MVLFSGHRLPCPHLLRYIRTIYFLYYLGLRNLSVSIKMYLYLFYFINVTFIMDEGGCAECRCRMEAWFVKKLGTGECTASAVLGG